MRSNEKTIKQDDDGLDLWWTNEDQFRAFPYMNIRHAARIAAYALGAHHILEHGGGGSTLWLAQIAPHAILYVQEHDPIWKERIRLGLEALAGCGVPLAVVQAASGGEQFESPFDLVIVDGESDERPVRIREGWDLLRPGGSLFLHDAERALYREPLKSLEAQGGMVVYCDINECPTAALVQMKKPLEP